MILAPLFGTVAGLLALAGFLKLRSPAHGSDTYPAPGPALGARGARAVAMAELGLGCAALAVPGRVVAAVTAAAFAAFAAYTIRLLVTSDGPADCGCFGESGGTVGPGHVVLDLASAAIGLAAAISPPRALASIVAHAPFTGAVLVCGVAAAVYALYLAYTQLPAAWSAYAGAAQE
jgi:methylamine utilization protein MauE